MRVLIVEDNPDVAASLRSGLGDTYVLDFAKTGEAGLTLGESNDYDLLILDLGLPDISGHEVCRGLREAAVKTPILILSANLEEAEKVALLDSGADDYLTKPFSLAELKARLRALLRRDASQLRDNVIRVAGLQLDPQSREVYRDGHYIQLRRKEFDLLEYLMRNHGYVVSRQKMLDHVWGGETDSWNNAVDVHIKYLRDKIDRPFKQKLIKTVHGVGYKIDADE